MSVPTTAITLPCLSLIDPYARLVVGGVKTIETRTGPVLSGFSGPLLISVSKKKPLPFDASAWGVQVPLFPGDGPGSLAGCVIGVVWVSETWRPGAGGGFVAPDGRWIAEASVLERHALHPVHGRYLSWISQAAWLSRPIPVRGFPGRSPVSIDPSLLPSWALPGEER